MRRIIGNSLVSVDGVVPDDPVGMGFADHYDDLSATRPSSCTRRARDNPSCSWFLAAPDAAAQRVKSTDLMRRAGSSATNTLAPMCVSWRSTDRFTSSAVWLPSTPSFKSRAPATRFVGARGLVVSGLIIDDPKIETREAFWIAEAVNFND